MRNIEVAIRREIENRDDTWVERAEELARDFTDKEKEHQLRNLLDVAVRTSSWKAFELFTRYQAARNYIDKEWAEMAIQRLEALRSDARGLLGAGYPEEKVREVHMQLVSRVLGYTVRWYVWNTKGQGRE